MGEIIKNRKEREREFISTTSVKAESHKQEMVR